MYWYTAITEKGGTAAICLKRARQGSERTMEQRSRDAHLICCATVPDSGLDAFTYVCIVDHKSYKHVYTALLLGAVA